jgi:glycerophosphoryl diester phosphodiesterase
MSFKFLRLSVFLRVSSLVMVAVFLSVPQTSLAGLKDRLKFPVVGAHQGGVFGPHGPNSLAQFQFAARNGAQIIELDLRISKDNHVVVFHDENLANLTNCRGPVRNKTLSELQQCTYFDKPDRIASFREVLAWSQGAYIINAEFKDTETIAGAIQLVAEYSANQWTYFQTQNSREKYQIARTLSPDVHLLYRIQTPEDLSWVESFEDENLIIIEIDQRMRSKDAIQRIHRLDKLVSEDSFDFDRLKEVFSAQCDKVFSLGIDIAITNKTRSCVKQARKFRTGGSDYRRDSENQSIQ